MNLRLKEEKYLTYGGPEDFIFIRAIRKDEKLLYDLSEKLIANKVRVFFDLCDSPYEHIPDEVSGGILNAKMCVFILSKDAVENLDFRNSVNYAKSIRRDTVCLKEKDFELGHGLDMQLASTPIYKNREELYNYLLNEEKLSSCKGEGQLFNNSDHSRRNIALITFGVALLILIASVFVIRNRIAYYNSAEYLLGRIGETEYLDFSSFKQEDLIYLEGKKITKLSCADMKLRDLSGVEKIELKEIDISGNPSLIDVEALKNSKTLEKVYLSQDMLGYAEVLYNSGLEVIITR
ncbi:MAG: toll/interleukin-1 receptor domain-containing protein [Erysipelotrichaceae bacterium]|nr:toll/interleukin-1 receptor domain-containing protein [Erysipelotrichaceae bacterium]